MTSKLRKYFYIQFAYLRERGSAFTFGNTSSSPEVCDPELMEGFQAMSRRTAGLGGTDSMLEVPSLTDSSSDLIPAQTQSKQTRGSLKHK